MGGIKQRVGGGGKKKRGNEERGQRAQRNKDGARFIMMIPTEQQHMASSH